ncbi:hypothetical protein JK358_12185 [Nocardia sp. 2]|uniref:Uncharacterized protein n=1 Tax=Nocardia acididurans TaxID=2802282 RepID=A0ABS1M3Q0_9NOCA|nr:hypothetical protein [Nocardia acididurans]MBL1075151.1 hypothetical protein [Nocardia acididurans]
MEGTGPIEAVRPPLARRLVCRVRLARLDSGHGLGRRLHRVTRLGRRRGGLGRRLHRVTRL